MNRQPRAVVFAYHSVGVRAIQVLQALGVEIALILTHQDDPGENTWFDSVRDVADWAGIPCLAPEDPNTPQLRDTLAACAPDWLFSFYYRRLLAPELLAIPTQGAFNLHGSLLPSYRGRAPLNWVLVHGEHQTGMSLHRMLVKPDAGALVDQETVPIFPNDTAAVLMPRLLCAGERLLLRALPAMFDGRASETAMDLSAGSYFGGRRPEDGRIDPGASAWSIHNLIRAVAPPYPGAFLYHQGQRLDLLGSWYQGEAARAPQAALYWEDDCCWLDGSDGERIRITRIEIEGAPLSAARCRDRFDCARLELG
ncbi:formyltransferase [Rhabdochromatium marinum]|uniref:formyltransferase n=1 Tax=Rhabdochromatium marinum TaxID=48729 RepID=UPI001904FBBE|nr:formyltransferase [Rhabdochromatium marinum]MBK1649194.1 formyltransferase [Rhabdochromatium marinum]